MLHDEETIVRVARAIRDATGCGLTRNDERVFCDHCDCHTAARAAIAAIPVPQAVSGDDVDLVARALEPKLFSDDPDTAHMAASPFKLEIMQERARDKARAAIAALPRDQIEAEVDGWRPIETAPKDGTRILIARADEPVDPDDIEISEWCSMEQSHWEQVEDDLYRKVIDAPYEFWNGNGHRATHWRPLPPPPVRHPDAGADLWSTLHTKPGERWDDNPFVVALTFRVEPRNIDAPDGGEG